MPLIIIVSPRLVVLNWGVIFAPGDIWQYLETFSAVIDESEESVGIQWVEARNGARPPTMHRTASHNKE